MKRVKHFEPNQHDEFWAALEEKANGHPIVGHMFGGIINYYVDNYHPDNIIGQDCMQGGYYLLEDAEGDDT